MMSVKQTVGQDPNKITALYERLSRDDDQVGDSKVLVFVIYHRQISSID